MTDRPIESAPASPAASASPGWASGRPWRIALAAGLAYFAGAWFGLTLTFAPVPVSVLWPPNAILLAVLLVAPRRAWPLILAAVLPAHLLAELPAGIPLPMALSWYASNCTEALIGAAGVRLATRPPFAFDRLHNVLAFLAFAVFFAPFLSSYLDAALVTLNGWGGAGYFEVWEGRFYSNVLAQMTLVPLIVTGWTAGLSALRRTSAARLVEAALLVFALVVFGVLAFDSEVAATGAALPSLLYLPVPILIWAALRFGPLGMSGSFALVAFLAIWGASHGRGPFALGTPAESARAIQLYLIFLAPPLLALISVLEERKAAESRLRSSEERFSKAFRSSPDAMSISRASDGRLIDVNHRWEQLFACPRGEALGQPLLDLLGVAGRELKELERGSAAGSVRDLEIEAVNRRGDRLHLLVAMETIGIEGVSCRLATIRDVTRERRAEVEAHQQRRQLTHLARVNLVGELSGALAHELKQPLTAILVNAQAAQRFLSHTPVDLAELREIMDDIETADHRATTVIHRLRALLRKDDGERGRLDLNEVLEETLDLAHGEVVSHYVTVRTGLTPRLPPIEGDRIQLQQLFLNLITNACEAMAEIEPAARILTVRSSREPHELVVASISDTGPGIPANRLQDVFEPFVTTKPNGLGLGLAICRTIVTAHGGRIWAQNGRERGVLFFTEIPSTPGAGG